MFFKKNIANLRRLLCVMLACFHRLCQNNSTFVSCEPPCAFITISHSTLSILINSWTIMYLAKQEKFELDVMSFDPIHVTIFVEVCHGIVLDVQCSFYHIIYGHKIYHQDRIQRDRVQLHPLWRLTLQSSPILIFHLRGEIHFTPQPGYEKFR